jgi:hypothetical protein
LWSSSRLCNGLGAQGNADSLVINRCLKVYATHRVAVYGDMFVMLRMRICERCPELKSAKRSALDTTASETGFIATGNELQYVSLCIHHSRHFDCLEAYAVESSRAISRLKSWTGRRVIRMLQYLPGTAVILAIFDPQKSAMERNSP